MAGMGPAPKPDAQRRRRNPTVAMTQLPLGGRKGRCPRWPLIPDIALTVRRDLAAAKVENLAWEVEELRHLGKTNPSLERRLDAAREALAITVAQLAEKPKLEAAVWREVWKTPQAAQWEQLGWQREVAQYVRWRVLGELGDLDAAKEARQWSDRLGLTPLAMLRLRWAVATDEVTERRQTRAAADGRTQPVRAQDRMRVVDPNVARS